MNGEDYTTLREKIIEILMNSEKPLSARDLAHLLGLNPRDISIIYDALTHVAKTIRRKTLNRYELAMIPPTCRNCGYIFKDLDKPRKPSRCPRCKSERISEPLFFIRER